MNYVLEFELRFSCKTVVNEVLVFDVVATPVANNIVMIAGQL